MSRKTSQLPLNLQKDLEYYLLVHVMSIKRHVNKAVVVAPHYWRPSQAKGENP